MASSSTNSPSTFSSATATSANGQTKTGVVTGYPMVARPGEPRVLVTGYHRVRTPPPPTIYFHRIFNHRKEQPSLYRLAAAALSFFLFTGCLLFILWLFLRPRLPQVYLASATLSPLATTATNVSVACNVSLLLTNPNSKATIFYDSLELIVVYQPHKVPLFNAQVPPFVQPRENDTVLHAQMEISNASVGNEVVEALKGDLVRGSMSFGVKVFVLMRLESKDWKTRSHVIRVYCDDVILGFSSVNGQGNMIDPYKECQIDL